MVLIALFFNTPSERFTCDMTCFLKYWWFSEREKQQRITYEACLKQSSLVWCTSLSNKLCMIATVECRVGAEACCWCLGDGAIVALIVFTSLLCFSDEIVGTTQNVLLKWFLGDSIVYVLCVILYSQMAYQIVLVNVSTQRDWNCLRAVFSCERLHLSRK